MNSLGPAASEVDNPSNLDVYLERLGEHVQELDRLMRILQGVDMKLRRQLDGRDSTEPAQIEKRNTSSFAAVTEVMATHSEQLMGLAESIRKSVSPDGCGLDKPAS